MCMCVAQGFLTDEQVYIFITLLARGGGGAALQTGEMQNQARLVESVS
jgi:hypothetical protein